MRFSLFIVVMLLLPVASAATLEYSWTYMDTHGHRHKLRLSVRIDQDYLSAYADFTVYERFDYDRMVTTRDPAVKQIAGELKNMSQEMGFDSYDEICLALSFVQSLSYKLDNETTPYEDYTRFPMETLSESGGDCEDTSVLYASIIIDMGYGAALLLPIENNQTFHMAVGVMGQDYPGFFVVYEGVRYYYAETTGEGYRVGDLPHEIRGSFMKVLEITDAEYDPFHHEVKDARTDSFLIIAIPLLMAGLALCVYAIFMALRGETGDELSEYPAEYPGLMDEFLPHYGHRHEDAVLQPREYAIQMEETRYWRSKGPWHATRGSMASYPYGASRSPRDATDYGFNVPELELPHEESSDRTSSGTPIPLDLCPRCGSRMVMIISGEGECPACGYRR